MNVEHCISKIGCWFQGVAFYQNISETCCSNFLGWQTSWGQLWVWQAHPREEVVKKAAYWISPTPQPHPSIPSSGLFAPVSKVRIRVLRLCGIRATSYNLAFNPTSSPSRISEESLTIFVRNTFAFLRQMTSKSSTSCVWWLTSRVEQSGCEGGWKSSLCTSVGAPWLLSVRPSSPR